MDKTQLRSFHAVAKNKGFTAASHALHISQPTLSAQVKALEEYYDTELFHRKGRRISLTYVGKKLYHITTKLNLIEEEAENLLNSCKGLKTGNLNFAAIGPFLATDIIASYKSKYPQVNINVLLGNSKQGFDRLLSYEADIGLIAEMKPDPRVIVTPYCTHEVVAFVNDGHRFFKRKSISIKELENEKVVERESGSTTRKAIQSALTEHGTKVNPVLEIGSREGVWKAVEQGLGVGFVADFEFIPHPRLKAVPIIDAEVKINYFIACLKERKHSLIIRSFYKTVFQNQNGHSKSKSLP